MCVVGLVLLRRRRQPILPVLAPIATVVVITLLGYGTMRFRVALDALLPGLAAIAIDALWSRYRQPRGTVLLDS